LIEGDRAVRKHRDEGGWTLDRLWRKIVKHASWLLIAVATGGAWVMYFYDAPSLMRDLASLSPSPGALGFIGLFTATTYLLAGWAHEQVCTYMCPWPRFQSAMVDRNTLTVMYREWRGEPRGKIARNGLTSPQRGDCIDCHSCVTVCPTGIDIRDGLQLQCIGCGLCIDACDEVMIRIGRPTGLIAYTSQAMREAKGTTVGDFMTALRSAVLRPRTAIYAAVLLIGSSAMLTSLLSRSDFELSVLADRTPLYVLLSDGSLRDAYTIKILNKGPQPREFRLSASGLPGALLSIAEQDAAPGAASAGVVLRVDGDSVGTFRALLHAPADAVSGEAPIAFTVTPSTGGERPVTHPSVFHGPVK